MKLRLLKTLFLLLLIVPVAVWLAPRAFTYSAGSPAGYTGSPYDAVSCATSGCHPGIPQTASGWITTDIPITGFYPDCTYTISLNATRSGAGRFGFQLAAFEIDNTFTGQFILADPNQTQFGTAYRYINHTLAGSYGSGGKKTWTVKWKAPSFSYQVTFYAAFIAGNGIQAQDITYLSDAWHPSVFMGFNTTEQAAGAKISPNPVSTWAELSIILSFPQQLTISLFSSSGQRLSTTVETAHAAGNFRLTRDFSNLRPGMYFLNISSIEKDITLKIIKLS